MTLMLATYSEVTPSQAGAWVLQTLLMGMILFYGWLSIKISRRAMITGQPFGIPDAVCTTILGIWMISIVWTGTHPTASQAITLQAILANCILYGSLIIGIFGVIAFQKNSAIAIFQLHPSRFPKAAAKGLLWLLVVYPLILAIQAVTQQLSGNNDDSQEIVRYFLEHPDLKHRLAVILMAVIVAPVAEEIIFRGYFYGVIRKFSGRIPAILISSLLFAAIHVHLPSAPGLFILAITLCLLYERTGSLWGNITMHAAFNASTIVVLILWPKMAS